MSLSGTIRDGLALETDPAMSRAQTIFETFRQAVADFGPHAFIHIPPEATARYAEGPVDWTYTQADAAVAALAGAYRAAGFVAGHRVALAMDNRADFFLHVLALNGLGASVVPLNAEMAAAELGYILKHSDAAAAVCLAEHVGKVEAARDAVGLALPVCAVGAAVAAPARAPAAALTDDAPAREAALLYTSGTTGSPKGCILSNAYFLAAGGLYVSLGGYCAFRPGVERLITPLPVTHMNALACSFMAMMMVGGCVIQLDRFHPSSWWRSVRESRATCLHYLGVMPAMLLGAPESPEDDMSGQIRFGFGAGVDPRHHVRFEDRFGFPLVEAWAMTETGGAAWITANVEPRHRGQRCFGKAPAGLAWRIVDEAGADAPVGTPGELLVRRAEGDPRAGFFTAYYKDPEATATAWEGGWFHTGDVVKVDDAGSFYFVDRLKNVVRRSGENIAAVEVESILMQHPAVAACAVVPVPDEIRGEEVFACVVVRPDHAADAATARAIFDAAMEKLVYFKAPGYIAFVETLPQTASQKLARGAIKKLALDRLEARDMIDLCALKKRPKTPGAGH